MAEVVVHLFHGFLGEPQDWSPIVERLPGFTVKTHDLVDDFNLLNDRTLKGWADVKSHQLLSEAAKKHIVMGYSLGGRLLMHLQPECFEKMILIASHPGLLEGKELREQMDNRWVTQYQKQSPENWLMAWNSQDVFSSDKNRPQRKLSSEKMQVYLKILKSWSLSQQQACDNFLKANQEKVHWVCGEEDQKFMSLRGRLLESLQPGHIHTIPHSGHGVIFDQPQAVADLLKEVI